MSDLTSEPTSETKNPLPSPEEKVAIDRRRFLIGSGKWSAAAILAAIGGVGASWVPDAGARGSWLNRRGGGSGGWINRRGGGWINRPSSWINRPGGWINRPSSWINRPGSWFNSRGW